jgi:hypothetical protein
MYSAWFQKLFFLILRNLILTSAGRLTLPEKNPPAAVKLKQLDKYIYNLILR